VMAGVAGALLLLWGAAWALVRALRRLPRESLPYLARQGLANLYRPGNQTRTVVLALGFGVYLLATLLLTQHNLLLPLRTDGAATRANLLLWDVQEDQEPAVAAELRAQGLPVLQRAPIVPMRVAAINGEAVRAWTDAELEEENGGGPDGWAVRREYRSTYRDTLLTSERLLEGDFWEPDVRGIQQVSLERGIAEDLDVALGDTITWDVQGVRLPTVVTSLREVDWARFEPNFFAVFPTAALEPAPKSWVVLTRAATPAARAGLQRDLVARFSNVAVLDLTQVQEALDEVIGRVSAVIRFLAAFSVATGFVVLLGAIATSRLQRIRESVLLKTLGATRRQIGWILLAEYLLLGVLSVAVGAALAAAAGWALARWVFEVPFELAPLPLAVLGVATVLLAAATGVWASREVFRRTPLEAIREE
jgi:putative ABC transport system permease protein